MLNNLQAQLVYHHGPISGTFRLREPILGEAQDGRPFVRLRLEDMSGYVYAYSWQEYMREAASMDDLTRVYIEGQIKARGDEQVIELSTLFPINVRSGGIARLIPQSICPQPWLLPYLDAAVGRITILSLLRFVETVLADDSIAFPFVSAPGSLNHHHNYPGGLLKHSLESFNIIEKQHGFTRNSYELGLVAALFHDIGKILTLTHEMQRTSLGVSTDHDKLTCEVLSPALRQLQQEWPDGAKELRYLLGWKVRTQVPHYNMADLVACSDRISAGMDMSKRCS